MHCILNHCLGAQYSPHWTSERLTIWFLNAQICVLHSVDRGPVAAEYHVSGTTYAPEGFLFDNTGVQVAISIT